MKSCVGSVTRERLKRLTRITSSSQANSLPHKALAEFPGPGHAVFSEQRR